MGLARVSDFRYFGFVAFRDLHEIGEMFAGLSVFDTRGPADARAWFAESNRYWIRGAFAGSDKLDGTKPSKQRERRKDPAYRRKYVARQRERMTSDPEYRARMLKYKREWRRAKYASDPEHRREEIRKAVERQKGKKV